MRSRPSSSLAVGSAGYLLFALAFAAHCSYVALRDHYTVPNVDDWRILNDLFSYPLLDWIFTDQNGHRIPVTLGLFFLDYRFFLGKMHLLVVAGQLSAWLAVGALCVGFRAGAGLGDPIARASFGFCVFCLFWAGSCFDFAWGTNQGTQLGVMFLAVALAALAVYQGRRQAVTRGSGVGLLALGPLATFAATFSHGMGAAAWVALNAAAIVGRLSWRVIAAFMAAAVATVTFYGRGLRSVPFGKFSSYPQQLIKQTSAFFEFAAAFVGSPVAHVLGGFGVIEQGEYFDTAAVAGTVGCALFGAYVLFLLLRRARADAVEMIAAGLMAFSIAGGMIVALNRLVFPTAAVSDRFLTWSVLSWMGAACALTRLSHGRRGAGWLALLLVTTLSASMLPALRDARAHLGERRHRIELEAAMHLSGVRWDAMASILGTRHEIVYRVVDELRRERRGFFADGRYELPGEPLSRHFVSVPNERCEGSIGFIERISARDGPAVMLSGHVWDRAENRAPMSVVITDSRGIIRGLGAVAADADPKRSPLESGLGAPGAKWGGFVHWSERARYSVYAVLAGGREVCAIGVWPR